MGCGCNKGAKKVAPIKITKKPISNNSSSARTTSSVRRIIKRPAR